MLKRMILATALLALGSAATAQQAAAPKPLTRAEVIAKLDSNFATDDTNHDGSLSVSEIQASQNRELQQLLAQQRAKLQAEFKQLDTNKDGQLSLQEFSAVISGVKPTLTAAQILQQYDSNHDGKVTPEEFKAPKLATFNKIDTNHDGTLSIEEMNRAGQK